MRVKKTASDHLTEGAHAELAALASLPDDHNDIAKIPEQRDWNSARRGSLFRPVKQQITLRLDADLIDWFRRHPSGGEGYQTSINRGGGG